MITDVTDEAIVQLHVLADQLQIPHDVVVFKIDAKMRLPSKLLWYVTADTSFDKRYVPVTVRGIRFAVEQKSAIYLVGVSIDYDEKLLTEYNLYAPVATEAGKPVWPRGFVFENQTLQNHYT